MQWKIHFQNNIFFYCILLLIILVGAISYNRFIIKHDYIVGYEGICDPLLEKCFINCADGNECTYYSKVQKYAPDLYAECGKDITDCETANICLSRDRKCTVTFCNTEIDGAICSGGTQKLNTPNDNQETIKTENAPINNTNTIKK